MKVLKAIAAFFLCCFFISATGQDFLRRDGKKIVNAKGENVLLRGMGLGGWMLQEGYMLGINKEGQQYRIKKRVEELIGKEKTEEFYDAWLRNHTTKADIDSLRSWGFNSVRLPMHYNLYTLPIEQEPVAGRQTWIDKGFKMTDNLVAWCKANNLYLVLDLHAAPGGQGNDNNISDRDPSKPSLWDSEANRQKTIALWKKLAERYKNETTIGAYDIINEPNWGFEDAEDKNGLKEKKNEPLEKLMREITAAIREVDKNHLIIIEGNGWGNNYNGILDDGLWDSNMALSFHKYWNYNDEASIAHILKYRDDHNVPVWLGETGENSNVWFTQAIHLLESNNIGWAWWPLKKLGFNNPLQVKKPQGYQQILNYWNGSIKIPLNVDFKRSLIALAKNTNIKKNILHRDVIDAMIRQPFSNETRPFKEHLISSSSIIKAVDYDLGKNGIAYYDLDTANYRVSGKPGIGNKGSTYRNDGVDIFKEEKTDDVYVGSIENGEWLQYTLTIKEPGTYKLEFSIAAKAEGKILLTLFAKEGDFLAETIVPVTGTGISWKTVSIGNIKLDKGIQTIRIKAAKGGYNLKELKFVMN
jgi:aryl-phospho-beta-D-glucosidase BglC (GH1 family)